LLLKLSLPIQLTKNNKKNMNTPASPKHNLFITPTQKLKSKKLKILPTHPPSTILIKMLIGNNSPSQNWKSLKFLSIILAAAFLCSLFLLNPSRKPLLSSILESEELEFQSYMSRFSKSYSESDYSSRFLKFRENQAYVRKFNSMQSDVTLAVNKFADMSFEEFSSKYLKTKDLSETSHIPRPELSLEAINATVDWRTEGVLTEVKNQGQCGSCWAFSATGAMEAAWVIFNKKPLVSLSEQQLVSCSKGQNQGCDGGFAVYAMDYVASNGGINSEAAYPYLGKDATCNATLQEEVVAYVNNTAGVPTGNYIALMASVQRQPTSTGVEANIQWMFYHSGIITQGCGMNINHDTLAVGYDSTAAVPYWIVKNSWGTDWGIKGYIQIGMSAGVGVCAINLDAYYPIISKEDS
jgi:C1A family cysteine protease